MSSSSPRRSSGALEITHMALTAVLWLIGLAVVIVGSLLLSDARTSGLQSLQQFGPLQNAALLVIIIGALIIVLGILGCIAVNSRHRLMLLLFSFFLGCLIILEIAACVLAWYYQKGSTLQGKLEILIDRVIHQYHEVWRSGNDRYEDGNWNFNRNDLSFIEYTLRCCGSTRGIEDYTMRRITVPNSCFNRDYSIYGYNYDYNQGIMYNDIGCVKALQDFLFKHGLTLGLLCVLALLIEVTLIVLSLVFICKSSSDDSNSTQYKDVLKRKQQSQTPTRSETERAALVPRLQPYHTQSEQRRDMAISENIPIQPAAQYQETSNALKNSVLSENV
ncbi:tetraspanin-9-like [Tropilaelaps mercedesae]|uniref:Tetraspanin-9-like n=1 Tax=Tropilaelaps mercedesae TaxID=418985 RepID=A0A1V9XM50_9ACAR|nr:tetraspanin-9-like [Tropilaelaps mercedesae]